MNYSLIEEYLANPDNPGIRTRFEAWLAQDPKNRIEYQRYVKSIRRLKAVEPPDIPDSKIVWARLEEEIMGDVKPGNVESIDSRGKSRRFSRYLWQAAAAMLIAVSGYLLVQQGFDTGTVYTTALAETKQIELPDGSLVELNADSELRLGETFAEQERHLFLRGQAFFKVRTTATAFMVETDQGKITVLGTEFDVNSRYQKTTVVVREGLVQVENSARDTVRLAANERVVVSESIADMFKEQVDAEYLLGWLDDRFVFHKTPLDEAIQELERHYGADIELADKELRRLTLSGSYSYKSIDSTLKSFCLALNLRFAENNGHYTLYKN